MFTAYYNLAFISYLFYELKEKGPGKGHFSFPFRNLNWFSTVKPGTCHPVILPMNNTA